MSAELLEVSNITPDGPIEKDKPLEEVRQDPYPLPKDFEWCTMDLDDPAQVSGGMEPTLLASKYQVGGLITSCPDFTNGTHPASSKRYMSCLPRTTSRMRTRHSVSTIPQSSSGGE